MSSYNDIMIVGIIPIEISYFDKQFDYKEYNYIDQKYVKFIEQANMKAVPIINIYDFDLLKLELNNLSGILFPGGGIDLIKTKDNKKYYDNLQLLINNIITISAEINTIRPFGIYGICLGFLGLLNSHSKDFIKYDYIKNFNNNLKLNTNNILSKYLPFDVLNVLKSSEISYFYNRNHLSVNEFNNNYDLKNNFVILATYNIGEGEYIAMVKHKYLPYFGVMFHPEKQQYNFNLKINSNNSYLSLKNSFEFSLLIKNNFIQQNYYSNNDIFNYIFENYTPILRQDKFEYIYLFKKYNYN